MRAVTDLDLVQGLADALGAQVACTRPIAEDRGWLPTCRDVGTSGARVAPRLYVGLGVSGQVQHAVGMRGSGVVVPTVRGPADRDDHSGTGGSG